MMRPVLMILSLMVIAVISNPVDDQVADDDRTLTLLCPRGCDWVIGRRSTCSNSYATSCTSNANCTSPYGICNTYVVLKNNLGSTRESHSGSYCTQSSSTCGVQCSDTASLATCNGIF